MVDDFFKQWQVKIKQKRQVIEITCLLKARVQGAKLAN